MQALHAVSLHCLSCSSLLRSWECKSKAFASLEGTLTPTPASVSSGFSGGILSHTHVPPVLLSVTWITLAWRTSCLLHHPAQHCFPRSCFAFTRCSSALSPYSWLSAGRSNAVVSCPPWSSRSCGLPLCIVLSLAGHGTQMAGFSTYLVSTLR